ncbi:MAG: hypothetical protein K0S47_1016 [Herbinix sp.]|nr:hypothetical protein [Herbinix sp.]
MKKRNQVLIILTVIVMSATFLCGCTTKDKIIDDQQLINSDLLPFTEEPITLTVFAGLDSNLEGIIDDYNENEFFQELEKRSGVHLEFVIPEIGAEYDAYYSMIASDNFTNIISHYGYAYPDGLDAAVDDGFYLNLTPYLNTFLKNYNAARNRDSYTKNCTTTGADRVVACYSLYTKEQGPWMGMQVRKDWLDDLGLEIPVTYDDWEKMLTLFKTEKGAYSPLSLGADGFMEYSHGLSAGFGVYEDFMQVDGKVIYGPVQEGWKEYLTLLNSWYEKGLIDPNFMINGEWQVDRSMVENDQTGAWNAMYIMMSQYEGSATNMNVIPVASPVKKKGDKLHIRREDCSIGQPVTISADCEYPEIAMKLLDYLYTEEGSLLANYGRKDDTFTYNPEGKPRVTDKISKNKTYSMGQAQALYLLPPARLGGLYDWTRELDAVPVEDLAAYDVWSVGDDAYILPAFLSYNSDESKERSKIVSDVNNYMNDMTIKFITGVSNINEEWDSYIKQMKDMGLVRAVEITQNALDRFNSAN